MQLVLGSKNYSSWSLRPWLAMRQAGVAFDETVIELDMPTTGADIARLSPSGKVPALIDGDVVIWDSLAICEYVAELAPALWPAERAVRAQARAVSAEMHSGFAALRSNLPMNCRAFLPEVARSGDTEADIARILAIWHDCRTRRGAGGPFLFGAFSIADAMYAPVVWRFLTYAVPLPPLAQTYCETMRALPAMQEWLAGAKASRAIARYDAIG